MRCNVVRFLPENFIENKAVYLNHSASCDPVCGESGNQRGTGSASFLKNRISSPAPITANA
jgi:hypothetical protein